MTDERIKEMAKTAYYTARHSAVPWNHIERAIRTALEEYGKENGEEIAHLKRKLQSVESELDELRMAANAPDDFVIMSRRRWKEMLAAERAADTGKAYARGGHVLHYLVAGDKLFPAFTGNGPTSKVNAEYIAAAHDAMPALLQLAKAVGEYIEINQTHLDPEEKFLAMCDAFDALATNRAPCNCESKTGVHHGDCASNDPHGAASV